MKKISLRDAVLEFQSSYHSDYEYGVSDEDAAKGLRAALKAAGIAYRNDVVFDCGKLTTRKELREAQERRTACNYKTPSDLFTMNPMRESVIDAAFSSNGIFAMLRKTGA